MSRHRLIEGQLALPIFELPPVTYCRRCRLRLRDGSSIERGYGPTCWRRQQEQAKARKQRKRKTKEAAT